MKISVILCEGSQDISFISKILLANSYNRFVNKLAEIPSPFNMYFSKQLEKIKPTDHKFSNFSRGSTVPESVLYSDDHYIFLHCLNGDGSDKNRNELIDDYEKIISTDYDFTAEIANNIEMKYILFYDADSSYEERIREINTNTKDYFNIEGMDHMKFVDYKRSKIGCFIFFDEASPEKSGKLEDIIISMINNEDICILQATEQFLELNKFDKLDRSKKYDVLNDVYKGGCRYDTNKALISIMGQLQFSGSSNSVIISNTDYITKKIILENDNCKNIIELLSK